MSARPEPWRGRIFRVELDVDAADTDDVRSFIAWLSEWDRFVRLVAVNEREIPAGRETAEPLAGP